MVDLATTPDQRAETVLQTIRSRRAVRDFTHEPVSDDAVRKVLEAARWASSGGNRRLHKFIVVRDPRTLRLIRAVTPGMRPVPPALIVICTDIAKAEEEGVQYDRQSTRLIDVGTASMNMMVAAHALGLGTCPVTSFSRPGMAVMLDLPPKLVPELILTLGHPAPVVRTRKAVRVTVDDLTYWERYTPTAG